MYRYGGIYIDADAIVLDTLEPYFQILEDKDFFIARRSSHEKNHVSVGFYGSAPQSKIMHEYINSITTKLDTGKHISYNDLGAGMLTPTVDNYIESVEILPEREIQPITFEEAREVFVDKNLRYEDILLENQRIFMLFSGPFNNGLKKIDIQTLYYSDYFVSKVFRKALSADSFNAYLQADL